MANITIIIGAICAVLGVATYALSGAQSWTALIPAIIGAVLALMGFFARKPQHRAWSMHVAVLVAIVGLGGALPRVIRTARADEIANGMAFAAQIFFSLLMLVFIILAVRSFIEARRARKAV